MYELLASYLDFELEIGPGRGREYPVAVAHSPAGEAQATMHFPFDELALEKRLAVLQNALLGSGGDPRQILSPEELVVRNFGRDLFDALFTGEIHHCYEQSLEQAWQEDKGVRLKLRFQPSDLAVVPWEFLYDPRQSEYVSLSPTTPMVRYVELPQTVSPLSLSPPLRILAMIASPGGPEAPDIAREKDRVETALQGLQMRGLAELTWLEGQTSHHLQEAMQNGEWHVFHFLGQGGSSRRDPRGDQFSDKRFTTLADQEDEIHPLSVADLTLPLADHPSLRIALLNAREGAPRGQSHEGTSLRNIFTSTAAFLVRQGIPAVLAVPYEITDEAAIELHRTFYETLALGMPVDAALAAGRKAVSLAVTNTVEWGAPALFMSPPDGLVFSIQTEVIDEQPQVPVQAETLTEEPEPVPIIPPPLPIQPETPAEVLVSEPAPATPSQETEEPPPEVRPETEILIRTPQPIEPDMVLIPAGEFLMGSDPEQDREAYEAEQPQHGVFLPDFHIARMPITNAQYAAFVKASGYEAPNRWEDGAFPEGKEDYPVVYISWYDATVYCKWLSDKNGKVYRLPSEAEWEKAARGTDGRIYPWGNAWDPDRCNSHESGPGDITPVDTHPNGASPYGILDMAGNTWEWTWSLYRPYPYDPMDGREYPRAFGERVLRSGAFYSGARRVRCAYRDSGDVNDWRGNYGFRVVLARA